MRLLYLNKIYSNATWGAETFLNFALQELGVETTCVDYQQNEYKMARALQGVKNNVDAFLLQRGTGYLIPPQVLRSIQRPRFLLFTELVVRHPQQHYLLREHLFDHVFLRSLPCMEQVIQNGWLRNEQVSLIRSVVRPDFHKPLPNIAKEIDVLFVGSMLPRRQKILDALSKKFNVVVCSAFGTEMVELVNRAKIILNIHAEEFLDTETRVYEVLACRGFLITEKLSPESPFIDNVHLVEAANLDALIQNIDLYLKDSELRNKIAETGYQKVIAGHTYAAQAQQLLNTMRPLLPQTHAQKPALDGKLLQQAERAERILKIKDRIVSFPRRVYFKGKWLLRQYQTNTGKNPS